MEQQAGLCACCRDAQEKDPEYLSMVERSAELGRLEAETRSRSDKLLAYLQPVSQLMNQLTAKREPLLVYLKQLRRVQLAINNHQASLLQL